MTTKSNPSHPIVSTSAGAGNPTNGPSVGFPCSILCFMVFLRTVGLLQEVICLCLIGLMKLGTILLVLVLLLCGYTAYLLLLLCLEEE